MGKNELETAHDIRQRHQREVCALGQERGWVLVAFIGVISPWRDLVVAVPVPSFWK